jgi:hypothetical protein
MSRTLTSVPADRARCLDQASGAPTLRACLGEGEEALVLGDLSGSVAGGAGLNRRPRLGSRTAAVAARRFSSDGHRGRDPPERILERHVEGCGRVGTLATGAAPSSTERSEEVPQAPAEHVAQILDPDSLGTGAERASAGEAGGAEPSELVVLLAPLLVAEDAVGLGHLLEPVLGGAVPGVGVGMERPGELAVGALDFLLRGILRHPEDRVEVLLQPVLVQMVPSAFAQSPDSRATSAARSTRPRSR